MLEMLAEGVATRRGRRSALPPPRPRERPAARRAAARASPRSPPAARSPTPPTTRCVEEPQGTLVGTVNEDFAIESMRGDIFLLGNRSWRIRRVEAGRGARRGRARRAADDPVLARRGAGAHARAVGGGRRDLRERGGATSGADGAARGSARECGLSPEAARGSSSTTSRDGAAALGGVCRRRRRVVAERFFDEAGGMQLVVHAPFGGAHQPRLGPRAAQALLRQLRLRAAGGRHRRRHRALARPAAQLPARERLRLWCGARPLARRPRAGGAGGADVRDALALERDAARWRSLRFAGGKQGADAAPAHARRRPAGGRLPRQARLRRTTMTGGPIESPDHPLVDETIDDCLHEAMDVDGLDAVLGGDRPTARIACVAVDTRRRRRRFARDPELEPVHAPRRRAARGAPHARRDAAPGRCRSSPAGSARSTPAAIAEVRAAGLAGACATPTSCTTRCCRSASLPRPSSSVPAGSRWADALVARAARRGRAGRRRAALVAAERVAWRAPGAARRARSRRRCRRPLFAPPRSGERGGCAARRSSGAGSSASARRPCRRAGRAPGLAGVARRRSALARSSSARARALRGRLPSRARTDEEWCDRALPRAHPPPDARPPAARDRAGERGRPDALPLPLAARAARDAAARPPRAPRRDRAARRASSCRRVPGSAGPARARQRLPARRPRALCLGGVVAWGRLRAGAAAGRRARCAPPGRAGAARVRAARATCPGCSTAGGRRRRRSPRRGARPCTTASRGAAPRSPPTSRARTGLAPAAVEDALWTLVAHGLVTGDGFAGLRALIDPPRRPARRRALRMLAAAGARRSCRPAAGRCCARRRRRRRRPRDAERFARLWLAALGRRVARAARARDLHAAVARAAAGAATLEARGEVRGGRFVAGIVGEQFALPEAVEALRAVRRRRPAPRRSSVAAADPLNLVGIVVPGARVPPATTRSSPIATARRSRWATTRSCGSGSSGRRVSGTAPTVAHSSRGGAAI